MRTRTLLSMIVARSSIMYCSSRCIRKLISVCGRFQFSLERQYSVSCSILSRAHSSVVRRTEATPRSWPAMRGRLLPLGPAAVAVHDDRDVPRPALGSGTIERRRCDFSGHRAITILLNDNRLISLGADGDHFDRLADELADAAEIRLRVCRQFVERAAAGDFFLPAGQRFVDGLGAAKIVDVAGEARRLLAVDVVGGADLQLVEAAQHVEQHDGDRIDAAEPAGVAHGDDIEPAAAARAASDGAVFVAAVAQVLAGGVVLLGGERAAADAGRIGLHDADDAIDVAGRHAGAAGNADAGAVAAGDERIRAVIDVEQRALGAFEQQSLAGFCGREQQLGRVANVGPQVARRSAEYSRKIAAASSGLNSPGG